METYQSTWLYTYVLSIFAGPALMLAAFARLACWLPPNAVKVDPIEALRRKG